MLAREWRYFLLALGFFTRIPIPRYVDFHEAELNHAAKYFPLVGAVVGLAGAITFVLAQFVLPQAIAVLVSMTTTIYLTGAFHEDGLADSADGLGGGWEREQMLTIMQDSRIGTYGALALIGVLVAKFQALSYMPMLFVPLMLIAGHALSRLCAVWVMATAEYAKPSGKAKPLATHISMTHLLIANVLGLLPWLSLIGLMVASHHPTNMMIRFVVMTLTPVLIAWIWWRAKLLKHLQGYTGDTLGATQQITELMFYLGALVWSLQ